MKVVQDVMGVQTVMGLQGDDLVTGTVQDCTPIAEYAKARQNAGMVGSSEMRHAASLPLAIVETYCNVNGLTLDQWLGDPIHAKRMLNDPALADFRIWRGAA
jgi:hypothetical protein